MAKKSMLEREKKRELCAQKFAAKRQALKEAGDYEALSFRATRPRHVCITVAN